MACKVCQTCCWDAGAACTAAAGAVVAGGGAECCCGSALLWLAEERSAVVAGGGAEFLFLYSLACLMLKSKSPTTVRVGAAPCCWGGCAWDEDGRSSCCCWAAATLPAMRACILRSASMSCAEAPSPWRLTSNTPEAVCSTSGTLAPVPVPAEGWAAEAEGLAGSGARGGVVAWAAVASAPAERVLDIRSWILPRGECQTVGGNRAQRWTPTQQPPDDSALL
jgi:hypothetical protein